MDMVSLLRTQGHRRVKRFQSLGLALYFASRGVGHIPVEGGTKQPYTSTARVLVSK